jgi:antitoxin component YwqK of YwqJK toxin-antitoxin module
VSCSEEEVKEKKEPIYIETKDDLIEVKNGIYTEYHPGTDQKGVKFRGPQDEDKERHGIWYYYNTSGVQVSMTEYNHGIKNGVTMVKYDTGVIRYTGEYKENEQIGIWKTYDSTGVLLHEKDFALLR